MSFTTQTAPIVGQMAEEVLERIKITQNPYFAALSNGEMSKEEFCASQEKFYFAVAYFSRPMAQLISRISNPHHRLDILHNIVEEHGDFIPDKFHQTTFQKFLKTLGSDVEKIVHGTSSPAVNAFNTSLMGTCCSQPVEVGITCLGIIEYAFSGISTCIGKSLLERGWIAKEKLVHYNVHAELDKEHANEFFAIVEEDCEKPEIRTHITTGLELGAYIFDRLYRDL